MLRQKKIILLLLFLTLTIIPTNAQKFAVIGDYGDAGGNELAVANLVKIWSPDFIITVGDNNSLYWSLIHCSSHWMYMRDNELYRALIYFSICCKLKHRNNRYRALDNVNYLAKIALSGVIIWGVFFPLGEKMHENLDFWFF